MANQVLEQISVLTEKTETETRHYISNDVDNQRFALEMPNEKVDRIHNFLLHAMSLGQSYKVKQFTEESMGVELPQTPQMMSREEVQFITKMILSELVELNSTVADSSADALAMVRDCLGVDFNPNYRKPIKDNPDYEDQICAEQADAFVDINYYALNAAAKKGWNLDRIFYLVHTANMAKRWEDGKFHKNELGKIVKPPGWTEPCVVEEIANQRLYGSWNMRGDDEQ